MVGGSLALTSWLKRASQDECIMYGLSEGCKALPSPEVRGSALKLWQLVDDQNNAQLFDKYEVVNVNRVHYKEAILNTKHGQYSVRAFRDELGNTLDIWFFPDPRQQKTKYITFQDHDLDGIVNDAVSYGLARSMMPYSDSSPASRRRPRPRMYYQGAFNIHLGIIMQELQQ